VGLFLAVFFLAAVAYKLSHAPAFFAAARDLWPMRLLPERLLGAATVAVVGAEGLVGLGLLLPRWRRRSAVLAALLVALFTVLVAPQYDGCRCTWQLEWLVPESSLGFVLRNTLVLALAVGVARGRRRG
jgi:hypothetical protein